MQPIVASIEAMAASRGYQLDEQQGACINRLAHLAERVMHPSLLPSRKPKGLYIWGPVGRGKSFLLDAFFDRLALAEKKRFHFHEFFRELHARLFANASSERSMEDALDDMLEGCKLLCFDEFHLHDIGDAMLISRVFSAIFARQCALVTTSNYPPEGLLPNPLYHERFLPTIRLIEAHMDVVSIAGGVDYRSLGGEGDAFGLGAFVSPGNATQRHQLGLPEVTASRVELKVNHRPLRVMAASQGVLHVGFSDICEAPTATMDYLVLVKTYPRWIIEGIPRISTASPAAQQRFLNLVDVLYDTRCEVFMISTLPLNEAVDHCDIADIVRTRSRLSQMKQLHVKNDTEVAFGH
ncbi:cell division protein ZapE [Pseudomonas silvicola]|nr:cell division protein ZapE [Pseudomonas silvicola]